MKRLHIYEMNDCDWMLATSEDEARAGYLKETGVNEAEIFELDEADLARLTFIEDPEVPRAQWVKRTFREELARREAAGVTGPEFFASTEH